MQMLTLAGVGGGEGAFSMCNFWLIEALARVSDSSCALIAHQLAASPSGSPLAVQHACSRRPLITDLIPERTSLVSCPR